MIYILDPHTALIERRLGRNIDKDESFEVAIEPGNWFAAEHQGGGEFTLVGCTVAPPACLMSPWDAHHIIFVHPASPSYTRRHK